LLHLRIIFAQPNLSDSMISVIVIVLLTLSQKLHLDK